MNLAYFQKAIVGVTGMAVGAALVTFVRIAALEGVESARERHLAEIASGRTPTPRVVASGAVDCANVVATRLPIE